eukprot:11711455-Ditylum_brightwellii.AAC.1
MKGDLMHHLPLPLPLPLHPHQAAGFRIVGTPHPPNKWICYSLHQLAPFGSLNPGTIGFGSSDLAVAVHLHVLDLGGMTYD